MSTQFIDLLITEDDLTLTAGEPRLATDKDCIEQDIRHMIREHGLAVQMIANRNSVEIAYLAQRIEIEMEKDVRLVPGTAQVTQVTTGVFLATANTQQFGRLNVELGL